MAGTAGAIPAPETDLFRPIVVLKQGPHGQVVLLQEAGSGELMVARQIPVPVGHGIEEVVDTLEQAPSFEDHLDTHGLCPVLAVMTLQSRVWAISEFMLGYPLDHAAGLARLPPDLIFEWVHQLLTTLDSLHSLSPPWALGALTPGDVVVGVQGACIVDLHLYEHIYPQRAALEHMNDPSPFHAPEMHSAFTPTPKSDVYSVGAMAIWLLIGEHGGEHLEARLTELELPPAVISTLICMVAPLPGHRPTAAEALDMLPDTHPGLYDALPLLNVQSPVPWLDGSLRIATAQPNDRKLLATTGRRVQHTLRRVAPAKPLSPADPVPPVWMALLQGLDDWTWMAFRGDGLKVIGAFLFVALAGAGMVFMGRPHAMASPMADAVAPAPVGVLHTVGGHVYTRQAGQSSWRTVGYLPAWEGDLLSPSSGGSTRLQFGHGSRMDLDQGTLLVLSGGTVTWQLQLREGRMVLTLNASDTVGVDMGDVRGSVSSPIAIEFDRRAVDARPHLSVTSLAGEAHLQSPGGDVRLAAGQRLQVSEARLQQIVTPAPADAFEVRATRE